MTDQDIAELIKDLQEMAARVGAVFVPDPRKIEDLKKARRSRRSP